MAKKGARKNGIAYIFSYLLTWLSGLIVYFTLGQKDRAIKFHAAQAIILGAATFVLSFVPVVGWVISAVLWLYGLYVGWKGSQGHDMEMPVIGEYAGRLSK